MIVDDHEISRAAIGALLRTEGVHVADVAVGEAAIAVAIAFRPAVAIVDVTPADATGFRIADLLRALPATPTVLLTSSADKRRFASQLDGYRFVAKADLCVQALLARPGHGSTAPVGLPCPRRRTMAWSVSWRTTARSWLIRM